MGGILSQAMANVSAAEQHIQAITDLPPEAVSVQSQSVALIGEIMPAIAQLQALILSYAERAQSQLEQIDQSVNAAPLPLVMAQLKALQLDSSDVKSSVDLLSDRIVAAANQVYGFANPLAAVQSQLNAQTIALQSAMSDARNEEDSIHKRYLYLLALGPFGLVGLSVALGLYLKWKGDADNLEAQVNSAQFQISRLNIMMSATNQLITDFGNLSSKISGVRNTMSFLASDIAEVIDDTEQEGTRIVIALHIKGALAQVLILKSDAS